MSQVRYVSLHYSTDDLNFALWKLYFAALLSGCTTCSENEIRINFLSPLYRRIQSFLTFQWYGGTILAILEESPKKKERKKVHRTQLFRMYYPMYIQGNFGFIRNPTSPQLVSA